MTDESLIQQCNVCQKWETNFVRLSDKKGNVVCLCPEHAYELYGYVSVAGIWMKVK